MSRLAKDYIESNFKLPRSITTVERDLANGYYLSLVANQCGYLNNEAFSGTRDDFSPTVIVKNFKILSAALEDVGILISKNDVAQIISEQSGAAASIVLKIKQIRDKGGKQPSNNNFRDSLKSLRPKTFTRDFEIAKTLNPEEKFLRSAQQVLSAGTYNDIHLTCLEDSYHIFKYEADQKIAATIEREDTLHRNHRDDRRQRYLAKTKFLMESNRHATQNLTKNWAQTQQVKHERQVRDLQFDLATQKIDYLKQLNVSRAHKGEEIDGIDAFEKNLIRNGIGGNDDGGENLTTTYEDGEAFLNRMEEMTMKTWPSNEDVSNFMSQLKDRTKDKRVARYEKARRRRRNQVEQGTAGGAFDGDSELGDPVVDDLDDETLELQRTKVLQKEEKLRELEEQRLVSMQSISDAATQSFEIFSEECRRRYEESDERNKALQSVTEAKIKKKETARANNKHLCNDIVLDLITAAFDLAIGDFSRHLVEEMKTAPLELALKINESALQLADSTVDKLATPKIFNTELWPIFARLADNTGRWSVASVDSSNVDEQKEAMNIKSIAGNSNLDLNENASPLNYSEKSRGATLVRQEFILDRLLTTIGDVSSALESVSLNSTDNEKTVIPNPLALKSEEETLALNVMKTRPNAVLIMSSSFVTFKISEVLDTVGLLLGAVPYTVWDITRAVSFAIEIKPLIEGKNPSLTFSNLVALISAGTWSCPPELNNSPLSVQLMTVLGDLVEASNRILSVTGLVNTDKFVLSGLPFTLQTFAMALGLSLWVRRYVINAFKTQALAESDSSSIYEVLIITPQQHSSGQFCFAPSDEAMFARVLDWFMRGFSKETIPATETDLFQAMVSETGSGKPLPVRKNKAAAGDLTFEKSLLTEIIWVTTTRKTDFNQTIERGDGCNAVLDEFNTKVLAAVNEDSDMETVVLTKEAGLLGVISQFGLTTTVLLQFDTSTPLAPRSGENRCLPVTSIGAIAEGVISAILSVGTFLRALSTTPDDTASIICDKVTENTISLMQSRRNRLLPFENLLLLHSAREILLDATILRSAHDTIQKATVMTANHAGLYLMSLVCLGRHGGRSIALQESQFITMLKRSDDRWQHLCIETEKSLAQIELPAQPSALSKSKYLKVVDQVVGNLICRIGDIIDDRHIQWIRTAKEIEVHVNKTMNVTFSSLLQSLENVGRSLLIIVRSRIAAGISFSKCMDSAGCKELPFSITSRKFTDEGTLDRREMLKTLSSQLYQMLDQASASTLTTPSARNHMCGDSWTSLCAIDKSNYSNSSCGRLEDEVFLGVYTESIEMAIKLISSMLKCIGIMKDDVHMMSERLHQYIKLRYSYEHKVLKEWSAELHGSRAHDSGPMASKSFNIDSQQEAFFLSRYHFGVSDDARFDQISSCPVNRMTQIDNLAISMESRSQLSATVMADFSSPDFGAEIFSQILPMESWMAF